MKRTLHPARSRPKTKAARALGCRAFVDGRAVTNGVGRLPVCGQRLASGKCSGLDPIADARQVAFGHIMIADQFRAFREIGQYRADRAKGARQKTALFLTIGIRLALGVEMNETTDVRVIESPRRHARDHVAIVDEAVIDGSEFDFDIVTEIMQAYPRLAERVEAINWEQGIGIVRAGPACQGGERAAEAVAGDPQGSARPGASFFQ